MMQNTKHHPHVYVALSGGVDSAVSAALLQEQGYQVTGAFIKTWQPSFLECTAPTEREDARRVAAHLGIGFTTIDLADAYKNEVVDHMIREYSAGRTPNPDVMCNQQIKFGGFLKEALDRSADMIATGHYARVCTTQDTGSSPNRYEMLQGVDENKDQSYFLWTLTQERLGRTFFPVGELTKPEVRERAAALDLPVATKKDSQGVCFLGKLDMKEFLSHFINQETGHVLDVDGNRIGRHDGAIFYTLGQRHGFTVTQKGIADGPHYIISKDINANTITVGTREVQQRCDQVRSITLESCNWIAGDIPAPGRYDFRYRYRQIKQYGTLSCNEEHAVIEFDDPQQSVMPGQSLVVYDDERCLGGGIIAHTS